MCDSIEVMMKAKNCDDGHNLKWLLALLFVAILLLSIVPTASAGWDYYREIEIDHTKVNGSQDLSSFPVLISHTDDWLKDSAHGGGVKESHGYDIVFTNADDSSLLDYEIEKYDGTAGTLVAWVSIPTLDCASNTKIRMYYGNSAATDWSNPTGVWDTDYKMVQHLEESPDDADPALKDSTSNNNNGTDYGSMTSGDQAAGQIDGSIDFDGSGDYVEVPNSTSLNQDQTITVSAWIYPRNINADGWKRMVEKNSWIGNGWTFFHSRFYNPELHVFINGDNVNSNQIISENQWQHIAFTYNSTYLNIYYNGGEVYSAQKDYTLSSTNPLNIGHAKDAGDYFNGKIDEVRISSTARSGDWIATSYNNQNSPSTFYEVNNTAIPTGGTDPVPELPTMILFASGLVVLAGYVMLRKRNRQ